MKCRDCAKFTHDPEGYGGLGKCALDVKRSSLMRQWHKDRWETVIQDTLPFPGQVACGEFTSRRVASRTLVD